MTRGKDVPKRFFFDYYRQHNLAIKVVRIFNTYGPNMHLFDGRVISNFIMQALNNDDITIYGNGEQTRSFCYVDDLIDGLIKMMNTDSSITGPINLGNPFEISIKELAKLIINICESNSRLVFKERPEDDPEKEIPISHWQATY